MFERFFIKSLLLFALSAIGGQSCKMYLLQEVNRYYVCEETGFHLDIDVECMKRF